MQVIVRGLLKGTFLPFLIRLYVNLAVDKEPKNN
jgi:hypothetical protein